MGFYFLYLISNSCMFADKSKGSCNCFLAKRCTKYSLHRKLSIPDLLFFNYFEYVKLLYSVGVFPEVGLSKVTFLNCSFWNFRSFHGTFRKVLDGKHCWSLQTVFRRVSRNNNSLSKSVDLHKSKKWEHNTIL